jgi:hypothetical protein
MSTWSCTVQRSGRGVRSAPRLPGTSHAVAGPERGWPTLRGAPSATRIRASFRSRSCATWAAAGGDILLIVEGRCVWPTRNSPSDTQALHTLRRQRRRSTRPHLTGRSRSQPSSRPLVPVTRRETADLALRTRSALELGHTPCQPRIGPIILRGARLERSTSEGNQWQVATTPLLRIRIPHCASSGAAGSRHRLRFGAARPAGEHPRQTVAYVLAAGGSPAECAAALGLHPPATVSHELRSWPDKTPRRTDASTVKSRSRRDPPPVEVIGRQPGEANRSSLVRAVLVRASRCRHGLRHDRGRVATAPGPTARAVRQPHPPTTRRAPDADKSRQRRGRGLTSTANERTFTSTHFAPLVIHDHTTR